MINNCKLCSIALISIALVFMLVIFAGAAPYAYIPNAGSNNASVIDTATNTSTSTVDVGADPIGVAVTENYVYVANNASNNVSVIYTINNTIAASINGFNGPVGVAVTPNGKRAYVTNNATNNVSVINTTTKIVDDSVKKARNPTIFFTFDDHSIGPTSILDSEGVNETIAVVTRNLDLPSMHTLENNGWEIAAHSVHHNKSSEAEYKDSKPMISFTFDDNYIGQTLILDSKGVKGTIAVVTRNLDLPSMHTLENNGWEIASHSVHHNKSSEAEYKDSKDYLIKNGFNVVGFVTPFGGTNSTQDGWARKYYTWTRDVVTYPPGYSYYSHLCNYPPITTYHLRGTETKGHSLSELEKIVDAAQQNNYWIIWMVHSGDITNSDLSTLIDYIKAKNIDILPVRSALNVYRQYGTTP